ncbi:hypothetical protein E2K80_14015 [Rhodophyticola sp. CCM32]|uniref:hypothetical protein n=1 Tax=Rhodophyticola sp. CCM32 TaxID=2916397 RepID=UPI00107F05E8|nr:hypothetical protein [Rhodophyticola sp. CCM32]QBY01704.1 hypothetical protein E2K80_14015 [Rhodophyticola sp. CCM32]
MSEFLRPEVRLMLWRWREVLAAAALALLGLWIVLDRGRVLPAFGWVLIGVAVLMAALALRRMRFAGTGDGPGVVELIEGKITYLGPYYGGAVSLDDLRSLSRRCAADGRMYWVLAEMEQILVIPTDAHGADVLFDAFTRLDGLSTAHLLNSLRDTAPGTITLWRGTPGQP